MFFLQEWGVTRLTFEYDSEPFGKERDAAIIKLAKEAGVEVVIENSHTLYDLDRYGEREGRGAAWARLGLSCLQRLQSPPTTLITVILSEPARITLHTRSFD